MFDNLKQNWRRSKALKTAHNQNQNGQDTVCKDLSMNRYHVMRIHRIWEPTSSLINVSLQYEVRGYSNLSY